MIFGSIIGAGVRLNYDAPLNHFALHARTQGGYGALMPYRASFPTYSLVGFYRSPGGVVRVIGSDHVCYAIHADLTMRVLPVDLGDKAGLWAIYSASSDITHVPSCGSGVVESWTLDIDAAVNVFNLKIMGAELAVPASTFPPPHVGATQVPIDASGQVVLSKHPLVTIQPAASAGVPTGDFAVFAGSMTAAGYGSAVGTIRQDSLGGSYEILAPVTDVQVRFGVSVYNPFTAGFDQSVNPMSVPAYFSLTRG